MSEPADRPATDVYVLVEHRMNRVKRWVLMGIRALLSPEIRTSPMANFNKDGYGV